ncbi:recombinase family protein [Altererythrobacter sp. SALINAS58]|uniref:recombinase family protein n=1 Tax=Alteripontixanthobacter muriae TaxID=2705546 RepID=UPI001576C0CD|nr:recombinase family protein [Alteripontixanthobacter muriae]NTZ42565.1 recombinase family protein [Alteripontixanthobacter muriae]
MKKVRCAIYTRKSSEEGLEQDFNSLHAQREACAAYILSQASEGWSLLPEEYDDGGLSGGTLERPALQRLLKDIEAGKIDTVVVYKVDRLSRSLLDFAKLVETMDKAEVSFVSVTQSFNTTNSMGRLTLNMLLSFAQFEREVTAERIRDKIAASKAKGMWMGGNPPLGYAPEGRTLRIVEEHAALICDIYRRYMELGNVRLLKEQLDGEGVRVPLRQTSSGRSMGGVPFTRNQIYRILTNPIYLGEIHHKGQVYDGQHDAIVERDLWDKVQVRLEDNRQGTQQAATVKSSSLLAGLVFDDAGEPLVASHACKSKVRYRYYVSKALQHEPGSAGSGMRIPALELEKTVAEGLAAQFDNPLRLMALAHLQPRADEMKQFSRDCESLATKIRKRDRLLLRQLIRRIVIHRVQIQVQLRAGSLEEALNTPAAPDAPEHVELRIDAGLRRTGTVMRLVQADGTLAGSAEPQEHLVRLIHRARSWWTEMTSSGLTPAALAREHGVTSSYVSRLVRLNFLAPDILDHIISGTQPAGLDAKTLLNLHDLPLDWDEQKRMLQIT